MSLFSKKVINPSRCTSNSWSNIIDVFINSFKLSNTNRST
ncbi:Uncharacterised protein [Vibrio cholerae]|nr:Uncharacterised protein [Vibrio cholerae]